MLFRSKAEDVMNPLFLAFAMRTHQGPTPDDLAAAMKLYAAVQQVAPPIVTPTPIDDRPPREPDTPGITNPNWEAAPRIDRRDEDGGA